jgi:hypothetical protein
MSNCQARIATREFKIPGLAFANPGTKVPGTQITAFLTGECKEPGTKKVQVDEGDAFMYICDVCLDRWRLRTKKKEWYGWFDCDIPPDAPVYDSIWFWEQVLTLMNQVNKINLKRKEVSRETFHKFLREMDKQDREKEKEREKDTDLTDDEQINQLAESMSNTNIETPLIPNPKSQKGSIQRDLLDEQIAELKMWLDSTKSKPQPQKLFQEKLKELMNLQTQRKMLK